MGLFLKFYGTLFKSLCQLNQSLDLRNFCRYTEWLISGSYWLREGQPLIVDPKCWSENFREIPWNMDDEGCFCKIEVYERPI